MSKIVASFKDAVRGGELASWSIELGFKPEDGGKGIAVTDIDAATVGIGSPSQLSGFSSLLAMVAGGRVRCCI